MGVSGQYEYKNHILLNPLMTTEDMKSTSYHEYTHMMLTYSSSIGQLLYCFEKLFIPPNFDQDVNRFKAITSFFNKHTTKVQEGLAVFVECVMLILNGEGDACDNFINGLRLNNRTYFKYLEPLIFIVDNLKFCNDREEILKISSLVFNLGIESMNRPIYQLEPKEFYTSKTIQKMLSKPDFGYEYLPDKRFIRDLKDCKKTTDTLEGVKKYIISKIGPLPKSQDIKYEEDGLYRNKSFINAFFL